MSRANESAEKTSATLTDGVWLPVRTLGLGVMPVVSAAGALGLSLNCMWATELERTRLRSARLGSALQIRLTRVFPATQIAGREPEPITLRWLIPLTCRRDGPLRARRHALLARNHGKESPWPPSDGGLAPFARWHWSHPPPASPHPPRTL